MIGYYFYVGATKESGNKKTVNMLSMNKKMKETKQIFNIVKKLTPSNMKTVLYEDDPRHNFLSDFARISLATWANLTTQIGYDPIDAFSVVSYNLTPYVIPMEG